MRSVEHVHEGRVAVLADVRRILAGGDERFDAGAVAVANRPRERQELLHRSSS